ncbi:MAG: hypothetical protein A3J76_05585 [Candidatus Moranbacteria bacterium RBG_13_45_13]|nr:MAG: hypothetical protein A3J76_05585 [Candidatus Moranbacteria bacterium RBG_13_45_13]
MQIEKYWLVKIVCCEKPTFIEYENKTQAIAMMKHLIEIGVMCVLAGPFAKNGKRVYSFFDRGW